MNAQTPRHDRALGYRIRRIGDSSIFQGAALRRSYFEGWYFKLTTAGGETFAIIPGVSVTKSGDKHAFIQSIDGRTARTTYTSFPIAEFRYSKRRFEIAIGRSRFHAGGIELGIADSDHSISGAVEFAHPARYPVSPAVPGIMGWYRYVPFMECYHGVVSMDHGLHGALTINGERIDFTGGRGYIEKDWGTSFPGSWIWMQSNGFDCEGVSFMLSIAKIPWLGRSFVGFLSFVRTPESLSTFATWNGSTVSQLSLDAEGVSVVLESRRRRRGSDAPFERLSLRAKRGAPGGLKAPVEGAMERTIGESVSATIELDLEGIHAFRGTGNYGGLEIAGDATELWSGGA